MFNPFAEIADEDPTDFELVRQSVGGDRAALEKLILRHQAWIYNIAVRMVFQPHDAEEVTQEVLIKAITNLGGFQGHSQFRTWLYRIATNHILNMKRRGEETRGITFSDYAAGLDAVPSLDLPDPNSVSVDVPLLVEEAKLTCTTGMLMCLDRRQRLIFTLGEILGVSDTVGGEILEMSGDSFRQCLSRARRDLYQFMEGQCGLVNASNPCRCPKKTRGFIDEGHVDPRHLLFAAEHVISIKDAAKETTREIEDVLIQQYAAIYRDHPFLSVPDQTEWIRQLLDRHEIRRTLRLDEKS